MFSFASVVAIVLAGTTAEQTERKNAYYRDQNWGIAQGRDACTLFGFFEGRDMLWVRLKPDANKLDLFLTGDRFKSVDDSGIFLISVDFVRQSNFHRRYPVTTFSGTLELTAPGVRAEFPSDTMLAALKASDLVAFNLNDGSLIASLSLNGSAKAISALEVCARSLSTRDPNDPFDGKSFNFPSSTPSQEGRGNQ